MKLKNSLQVLFLYLIFLLACSFTNVKSSAMYTPDGRFLFGGYEEETNTSSENYGSTVPSYGECVLEQLNMPNQNQYNSQSFRCDINSCQNAGYLKAGSISLPIGSTAYITNSENKRVVQVIITHEGPVNPRIESRIAELPEETFCCLAGIDQRVFPCYVALKT